MSRHTIYRKTGIGLVAALLATTGLVAQDWAPTYSLYGTPGLIEMPSALSAADGDLATSFSGFGLQQRVGVTFQITPRLSGTFRYSRFGDYTGPDTADTFDRSFDLQYRLTDESGWMPALAFGLRDFAGTGLLTSEYVVATKTLTDNLRVTGGMGWGRMGSNNGFTNPLGVISDKFEVRPANDYGQGGVPSWNQYFRGDAALFAGVEYKLNPKTTMVVEYSSDAYTREVANGSFEHNSPLNFGLVWEPKDNYQFGLYSLYGSDLGLSFTAILNPASPGMPGGYDPSPVPVAVRSADARAAATWNRDVLPDEMLRGALAQALTLEGVQLNSVVLTDDTVRLRYTNTRYRSEVQAMGRVARILTQAMPGSVETFVLEPMQNGMPMSSTTMKRSDVEAFENRVGGTEQMYLRTLTVDVPAGGEFVSVPATEAFQWGIKPYSEITLFDSANPASIEVGIEASMDYHIRPNIIVSGSIRKSVWDNRDGVGTIKPSSLAPVRRNAPIYAIEGDGGIDDLTLAWYGRLSPTLYSRVTLGYLEQMHGGVSSEVLWKPVESRLAIGAEVNYTAQRDYDMGFGFQDYDIVSGHLSAYYELQSGFHLQVDAGRYLAGDWGTTISVNREFENGWRIGAYATLTDVPYEDFGEGSFDKGIMLTIPTDWASGKPTRNVVDTRLSSLTRDGGARLAVDGRLYDTVRGGHITDYNTSWGRFWR